MKLNVIRLSNFQCFGENPTELTLEKITYLIGLNGSGKTALLQGLSRMFAFNPHYVRFNVQISTANTVAAFAVQT